MPKVSIIVPVYGVEKYIERCARSLFDQTLDDIEYLFIDDCTPDKSIEILKNVLEEYPQRKNQVIIHRMEKNSGQAAVRKWGMLNATGDYIIHCDSDDWVEKSIYERLYNESVRKNADIVFCDYYICEESKPNRIFKKNPNIANKHEILKQLLLSSDLNPLWSALIKKRTISNIKYPQSAQGEDKAIMLQQCFYAYKFSYIEEPLYFYRISPGSICNTFEKNRLISRFQQTIDNVNIIINFAGEHNMTQDYKKELDACMFHARHLLENIKFDKECSKLWLNSYPKINGRILFNDYIKFRDKIRFICYYILFKFNSYML